MEKFKTEELETILWIMQFSHVWIASFDKETGKKFPAVVCPEEQRTCRVSYYSKKKDIEDGHENHYQGRCDGCGMTVGS